MLTLTIPCACACICMIMMQDFKVKMYIEHILYVHCIERTQCWHQQLTRIRIRITQLIDGECIVRGLIKQSSSAPSNVSQEFSPIYHEGVASAYTLYEPVGRARTLSPLRSSNIP